MSAGEMRAVVIARSGGPEVLELRRVAVRGPGRGEIGVRVHAVGVNRADLAQREGRYPAPTGWPAEIPGLEYAGVVETVGPGADGLRVGDRVMGLVGGGAYAEWVNVPVREVLPAPDRLSFVEAAAVPEAFITAHDALFARIGLAAGQTLLIHAVGSGVGTAALQLAKAAGATVIGTSRSGWKLERARVLGLDTVIDTSQADFVEPVREATGGRGVDAVLDLVGGSYLAGNLESLASKGRMVVVGLTGGREAGLDLGTVLRKRLTLVGTALRARPPEERAAAARAFADRGLSLLIDGRVRPVFDQVFALDEAAEAHRRMESNANFGKIVLAVVEP